ncbi:MAG: hypothetical protein JSS59_10385 [Proteobacteria bacterium]|uniref:hypothetical protein n=1 Tax=Rudaea sp. TaxID=2136325 RepID=UPI0037837348|nr:hypothetical protein [Pseudomonadota bacterium]
MKSLYRHLVLLAALQMLALGAAFAADKVIEKPVAADTPEKFAEVAAQIRKEMGASGRYEFIRPDDKAKANTDLDAIAAMLQKAGSVSAMPEGDRVQLFNTQERLNGILTHSDRNRLVCERRAPVGTNIPQNTCKTVAEIEKMRRDSQKYMNDHAQDANINSAAMHAERGSGH